MKPVEHTTQVQNRNFVSKYLNADWQKAQNHGLASKIGSMDKVKNLQFCPCCFHHIYKTPFPLSEDTKQLQFLGFGFPLYFSFVRNCIFLLLVMICCNNLPSLYYALAHNEQFCKTNLDHPKNITPHVVPSVQPLHPVHRKSHSLHFSTATESAVTQQKSQDEAAHQIQCTGWMIYLSRIEKVVTVEQELIRCGSFFVHFILLLYIREKLTKMKYYFDERTASPSDFAVFVKNMPPLIGQRKELLKFLRREYGDINPRQIILMPDLKVYVELESEQKKLFHQLEKEVSRKDPSSQKIRQIQSEIDKKQQQINKFLIKDKRLNEKDQLEAERAVVIFNTEDEKWQLINAAAYKKINIEGWKDLKVNEASEPEQVIWQNSCFNNQDKVYYKFLGWFLSIATLVLITGIFAVISRFKSKVVEQKIIQYQNNENRDPHLLGQAFAMVIGMILLVVLFNKFVLAHLFHYFTELGKHSSTYKFQFYFCLKYCLGLFFTTALMTLIIEDFIFANYFKHNFGVIEEETIMFLFNSSFVPLLWLINPTYLARRFKRWRNFGSHYMTQKDANNLMQDPVYDIGKRYGEVLEIMWFTFLYISLVPVGGVFSCLGLIAYYWVDKYNLLRRSTILSQISGDLIDLTLTMLDFTLVLRILGQMLFDYKIRQGTTVLTWAYLAIGVLYMFLPSELLINIFSSERFFTQKMSYDEAEVQFKNTYTDVHILFNRLEEDHNKMILSKKNRKQSRTEIKQKQDNQTLPKKRQQARIITKI